MLLVMTINVFKYAHAYTVTELRDKFTDLDASTAYATRVRHVEAATALDIVANT